MTKSTVPQAISPDTFDDCVDFLVRCGITRNKIADALGTRLPQLKRMREGTGSITPTHIKLLMEFIDELIEDQEEFEIKDVKLVFLEHHFESYGETLEKLSTYLSMSHIGEEEWDDELKRAQRVLAEVKTANFPKTKKKKKRRRSVFLR